MLNSVSRFTGFAINVDDKAALRLSPEGNPAAPLIDGPRLAVVGKIGPSCRACRDFQTVMVRRDGQIVTVDCKCAAKAATGDDDMPARIPTGAPRPGAVSALAR
ncbi:hypothetical protein ACIPC1_39765 [Streptomyces sp. NPDC087263]|uniref:hypothetical protein n=1 Tax=Streptomyces sp. NPDC087263 TaxID=3365773 RepID=UPI0037F99F3E